MSYDWRSWGGKPTPTTPQMLRSMRENVEQAEREKRLALDFIRRLPIGDRNMETARYRLVVAKAELAHWQEYEAYYRSRIATDGHLRLVEDKPASPAITEETI